MTLANLVLSLSKILDDYYKKNNLAIEASLQTTALFKELQQSLINRHLNKK